MARGKSGRIVIEVDPKLKRQLYGALGTQSQTLKDWFIKAANQFIDEPKRISSTGDDHHPTTDSGARV